MKLGVVEYIDCAHHLPDHPRCGRQHGHTYKVEVIIEGEKRGGMVVDFAEIKKELRDVLKEYDHRDWNEFLDYPSVENISELLASKLKGRLGFPFLLKLWEGHGKWAEVESR